MTGRQRLVLTVLSAGMFLVLLDVTVVNVALPDIRTSLGTSVATLQWVVDGYTVPLAALLLGGGTLADRYGHRRLLVGGMVVFGVGSLGCAASAWAAGSSATWLVAARALQGIGAAMLLPASQSGVADTFPERGLQARALGIWAGVASTALPTGPVIGGVLVHWFGWPGVFWANVPVVALLGVAVLRVVPADRRGRRPTHQRVDYLGAVAGTVGLGGAVLAIIEWGHHGWGAGVAVAAVVAVVAAAAFWVVEHRVHEPMLPPTLMRSTPFVSANLVAGTMNFAGIGSILLLTLLLQSVQGRSSVVSGLALLPLFVPLVVLSPVTGRLVERYGVRAPMVAGLLVGAVGSATLLGIDAGASLARLLPVMLGLGVGMGLLTAAVVTASIRAAPGDRSGVASGVVNAARQSGGSVGVAVYGALLGDPGRVGPFVRGVHVAGVVGAAAWIGAAVLASVAVRPGGPSGTAGGGGVRSAADGPRPATPRQPSGPRPRA